MGQTRPARHIFVGNRDPTVALVIAEILENEGYRLTVGGFRDRSVAAIGRLSPDLVILDFSWATSGNRWELLQLLRLHPTTARIPIVLCTGAIEAVRGSLDHLRSMGVSVVYKPFNIDQLVRSVAARLPA